MHHFFLSEEEIKYNEALACYENNNPVTQTVKLNDGTE